MNNTAEGSLRGRRIAIAGSASRCCSPDQLCRAHGLVRALVAAILKQGGSVVAFASDEPRLENGPDTGLIFDWTVLEAVDHALEGAELRAGGVWIVTAQKAIQRKIPADRRALVARLVSSGKAKVLMVDDAVYTGGNIRDAIVGCTDALIALGGGKGVTDLYRKLAAQHIPTVPLGLELGSYSEDGEGAVGLHREALVTPERFFYAAPDELRTFLVASSLQTETPDAIATRLVTVLAGELRARPVVPDRQRRAATDAATVDVVILTALPVELRAVQRTFGVTGGPAVTVFGTNYWLASAASERRGRPYSVLVACLGGPGNADAAVVATELIATFEPALIVMAGIAGGLRGKVRLGEVVLASRIVAYEPGAVVTVDGQPTHRPRPEMLRSSAMLEQDLAAYLAAAPECGCAAGLVRQGIQLPTLQAGEAEHVVEGFAIRADPLASGEKLIRDAPTAEALRQLHDKVVGLDMESFGVATAARRAQGDFLVVRGISDFADTTKDDRFHDYAAGAAATAVADFLQKGLLLGSQDDVAGGAS